MLDGYINEDELKLLSGLSGYQINRLIYKGLPVYKFDGIKYKHTPINETKNRLFKLSDVRDWFSMYVY